MNAPLVTIFVRHSAECRYSGDEFGKRCNFRKHFRWTQNGKQYRRKAGSRSWAAAEEVKRRLEDELAGRKPVSKDPQAGVLVSEAVQVFMQAKRNDRLEPPTGCSVPSRRRSCPSIFASRIRLPLMTSPGPVPSLSPGGQSASDIVPQTESVSGVPIT